MTIKLRTLFLFCTFNNIKDLEQIILHVLSQEFHALVYLYSHTHTGMWRREKRGECMREIFPFYNLFFQEKK